MSFLRIFRPTLSPLAGPSRLALPLARPSPSIPSSSPLLSALSQQQQTSSFSTSVVALKYKLKSHSGCKKRFFPNAAGNFKRSQAGKSHLNTSLSASKINKLAKRVWVTRTQAKKLRKLLPYA